MISAQSVWARECGLRLIGAYVYAPAGRRKHKAKGVECGIGNAECGNIGQRELNAEFGMWKVY